MTFATEVIFFKSDNKKNLYILKEDYGKEKVVFFGLLLCKDCCIEGTIDLLLCLTTTNDSA